MSLRRCATALLLASGLLSACGSDAVLPFDGEDAIFVLQTVNGRPLPVVVWSDESSTTELLEERITFRQDGRAERVWSVRRSGAGAASKVGTSTMIAEYRVRGKQVEIGRFSACPANALCLANDEGVLAGREMRLTSWLFARSEAARPVLTYRR